MGKLALEMASEMSLHRDAEHGSRGRVGGESMRKSGGKCRSLVNVPAARGGKSSNEWFER